MKRISYSQAWVTVAVLWAIALLNYLDRLVITTLHDPIKADIVMTDAQFGLLTSVFLWVYGLASPLGGYLADRYSRRTVILASLLIWSAVTWLTGHVHSFGELLATRALMGLSEACYLPAALALIADLHRGSTRSLATGLHMSGIYAGGALGGLGALVAEHTDWRHGFTLFGLVGVSYALFASLILRNAPTAPRNDARSKNPLAFSRAWSVLFGSAAFIILFVANALVGIANWGIYGWLPTFLRERFHLSLGAAGLTGSAYLQIASFAGVLVGGFWADRWSRRQPRARAWVPAIGFVVTAPLLFLGVGSPLLSIVIAGVLAYGLGRGFYDSNQMPILRSLIDDRYSATGYGFLNCGSVLMGGVMIYAGGSLKDRGVSLEHVFQSSAACLLGVGLLLLALRTRVTSGAGTGN